MAEDSFRSVLKGENMKLKKKIQELQDTLLKITGAVKIFASGTDKAQATLTAKIDSIISGAQEELYIVTPKVGPDYAKTLAEKAKSGTKIQIVINDRRLLTPEEQKKGKFKNKTTSDKVNYAQIYDFLKTNPGIDLVNNPNVQFLMLKTPSESLFSAGWLEKPVLEKTILLGTSITDKNKNKEIDTIYKELLPSFMR